MTALYFMEFDGKKGLNMQVLEWCGFTNSLVIQWCGMDWIPYPFDLLEEIDGKENSFNRSYNKITEETTLSERLPFSGGSFKLSLLFSNQLTFHKSNSFSRVSNQNVLVEFLLFVRFDYKCMSFVMSTYTQSWHTSKLLTEITVNALYQK